MMGQAVRARRLLQSAPLCMRSARNYSSARLVTVTNNANAHANTNTNANANAKALTCRRTKEKTLASVAVHSHNYCTSAVLRSSLPSQVDVDDSLLPLQSQDLPFTKILIANRGEIARRVIRTCKALNIKTVAIYSTIDSKSPHVTEADEAICIGPALSSASYLDVDRVCEAIRMSGAQGVHPGYGFLSENAQFAKRVENIMASFTSEDGTTTTTEPVKFIGPHSDAIVAMGDKITSKEIAKEAGVNVIPGYEKFVTSQDDAVRVANMIGYPVMIKATSGGGGKGMRICYKDDQVREGFVLSTAEAKSFFNDERLFIEKFIEKPHHIEIQVLAGHNSKSGELEILCFPERECSIQRRNQKILEESPSMLLKPETRAEMIRQVKKLVRKVDYVSAGTVEFLVDEEQNFYFLEMNTRLQVEHPVTEMVSGNVDLVYGMMSVAGGKGIPKVYLDLLGDQEGMSESERDGLGVPHTGHAIEARIYAEDPVRGFLPSTGPLLQYVEPSCTLEGDACQIRVDSGVVPGSLISQYYDPMISKLVAYSPNNRLESIQGLRKAIDSYVITGISHNTSFISDVLRHEAFVEGNTPTSFIETHYPDGFTSVQLTSIEEAEAVAIAASVSIWKGEVMQRPPLPMVDSVYGTYDDDETPSSELVVCLGGMFGTPFHVVADNVEEGVLTVTKMVKSEDEQHQHDEICHSVKLDDISIDVGNPIIDVVVNGKDKTLQIQNEDNTGLFGVRYEGAALDVLVMTPAEYELSRHMKKPKELDTSDMVLSPMPGTLISYAVEDGEAVVEGQEICIVEAMKMQNVIRSSRAGVIKKRLADIGGSLMADEVLVEFEKS